MDGVEAFSLRLGDGDLLDADDLESGLLDLGEDGGGVAFTDGVGLDDAECTFGHEVLLDQIDVSLV